ncbi:MAG: InlB B-repeat-containing protein [Candidatus Nanosyncoccaceae bacterium]|jgi:hypothetical protein
MTDPDFPAGMSYDEGTEEIVLNGYDGGPIRRVDEEPDNTINLRLIGDNAITSHTYGIEANAVYIKGSSTANLTISSQDTAIKRQPRIYDVTLSTNNKVDAGNAILYGTAKVIVTSDKPTYAFHNVDLWGSSSINININTSTSENIYGISSLNLRGTGQVSVSVNNAGSGAAQAINNEPTLPTDYSATDGDWNEGSVVYKYASSNASLSTIWAYMTYDGLGGWDSNDSFFNDSDTDYTIDIDSMYTTAELFIRLKEPEQTFKVTANGVEQSATVSGPGYATGRMTLSGSTTVDYVIEVTAANGVAKKTYNVRLQQPSAVTVTSIDIKSPPATTTYTDGDNLDLTGLEVTLNKSNSTSEDVALANFATNGLSTNPANGATLATTNDKVVISHTDGPTKNLTITVNPAPITYNLTITCGEGGTCTPNHANPYNDGETATITLAPASGKQVKSVAGVDGKENDTTYTVVMDSDKTVVVEFEDASPVTVTSVAVKTPPTTTTYTVGEALDLTGLVVTLGKSNGTYEDIALADFATNDLSTSPANGAVLAITGTTTIIITHDISYQSASQLIVVNPKTYTVTVKCGANGTCDGAGTYDEGATATVAAVAHDGYLIDKWMVGGVENTALSGLSNGNGGFFVTADTVVDISFKRDPAKTLLTLNCGAGGTCALNPEIIPRFYNIGADVYLNLSPEGGKKVGSVSNAVKDGDTTYIITMDVDKTVDVTFVDIPTYNLTINCGVGGACTPDHANPYSEGDIAFITVVPDIRKQVKSVTSATKVSDTEYSVLMDAAKAVTVEFEDAPVILDADKVTIKQNESLTVTIKNLAAEHEGKTVEFWLHSDPVKLGEGTVLYGSATVTALIPCGVKPGDHTVTARINGVDVGTPVTVTVLSSPACPVSPKTGVGSNYLTTAIAAISMIGLGAFGLIYSKRQQQN